MTERYEIHELTAEEKIRLPGKTHELTQRSRIVLGFHTSEESARVAREQWLARDEVEAKVRQFKDELHAEYSGRLSDKELSQMLS